MATILLLRLTKNTLTTPNMHKKSSLMLRILQLGACIVFTRKITKDYHVRVAKGIIRAYDKLEKEKTVVMDFACGNGMNYQLSLG
jgi:hypothetical protein